MAKRRTGVWKTELHPRDNKGRFTRGTPGAGWLAQAEQRLAAAGSPVAAHQRGEGRRQSWSDLLSAQMAPTQIDTSHATQYDGEVTDTPTPSPAPGGSDQTKPPRAEALRAEALRVAATGDHNRIRRLAASGILPQALSVKLRKASDSLASSPSYLRKAAEAHINSHLWSDTPQGPEVAPALPPGLEQRHMDVLNGAAKQGFTPRPGGITPSSAQRARYHEDLARMGYLRRSGSNDILTDKGREALGLPVEPKPAKVAKAPKKAVTPAAPAATPTEEARQHAASHAAATGHGVPTGPTVDNGDGTYTTPVPGGTIRVRRSFDGSYKVTQAPSPVAGAVGAPRPATTVQELHRQLGAVFAENSQANALPGRTNNAKTLGGYVVVRAALSVRQGMTRFMAPTVQRFGTQPQEKHRAADIDPATKRYFETQPSGDIYEYDRTTDRRRWVGRIDPTSMLAIDGAPTLPIHIQRDPDAGNQAWH